MSDKKLTIAVDFDGTIYKHEYPEIGEEIPFAVETIKELQNAGHRIMLWTMRSGEELDKAVNILESRGITLWGINENPQQHTWTESKKQFAHIYIDDAALGTPLIQDSFGLERPFVDWWHIRAHLKARGVL